jgi:hypothetical protein
LGEPQKQGFDAAEVYASALGLRPLAAVENLLFFHFVEASDEPLRACLHEATMRVLGGLV